METKNIMNFENPSNIDFTGFQLNSFSFGDEIKSRYIKPKRHKYLKDSQLYFKNAEKLAKSINLKGNDCVFCILDGSFIFGDFIEAIFYEKNIYTERIQISTLSMSYANIISLKNLMKGGFVKNLDLIISDYFFAHERRGLILDIYKELDFENRFQLAVVSSHIKVTSFKTELGKKYIIHGSANLRSSNCIEQITVEDNPDLFDFIEKHNNRILKKYSTINKSIRGKQLWQTLEEVEKVAAKTHAEAKRAALRARLRDTRTPF